MRLSDRSLLSELVVPVLIGLLAFLLMLVGNTLYQLLDRMMSEKWPVAYVARILLFNIPTVLVRTLPIAAAVGASLATSRLARDSELTALRAAGVSLRRAFAPLVFIGLALSGAGIYLFENVVPWVWEQQRDVQSVLTNLPENAIETATMIPIESYVFSFARAEGKRDNSGRKTFVVYDATILERGSGAPPRITTAARGSYRQQQFNFDNVAVHAYKPDRSVDYELTARSEEISVSLEKINGYGMPSDEQLENLSSAKLMERARTERDPRRAVVYAVARWRKLGLPLMCLPLALFAVPLAIRFARAGTFAALMLALVIVFLAVLALTGAEVVALNRWLPPFVAAIAPAVLFTVAALWFLRKLE
ncbi:LptF/LptG family permease [Armatimonas rosea]|uniref:Lipopolysaccharide export system permease protein n=1 Tax=Armatimonas rosea TaxID=685828 RepID=A0A7W9SU12_ARMRO|nr:LptF/LptG family permease [Armatimonas rosea]MBB6052328.1 lipopolysaccharide export system permease protein [Armatimonas rosea]